MMNILVACEESQAVTKELRKLGHMAFSCDLEPCGGGHPEWHMEQDVLPLLDMGWDMIIAFPPCTNLAVSGARWFPEKIADGRQQEGIDFFMKFVNAKCDKIVIENPVGIMSTKYKKPTQIVQPYEYGDPFTKTTCLWVKGLPNLSPTDIVDKGERTVFGSGKSHPKWYADTFKLSPKERAKARSRTFLGIAKAMSEQWAGPARSGEL